MSNRRAQTTAEYAVLIAVVVGALLTMQIYVKRGAMGRLRESADQMGEQFSPQHTHTKFSTSSHSARTEELKSDRSTRSALNEDETQTKGKVDGKGEGYEKVEDGLDQEKLF